MSPGATSSTRGGCRGSCTSTPGSSRTLASLAIGRSHDPSSNVNAILASYAATTESALWGSDEGRRFAAWAEAELGGAPLVQAALRLDCAGLESVRTGQLQIVELDVDPVALIDAIRNNRQPDDLPRGRFVVTVGDN